MGKNTASKGAHIQKEEPKRLRPTQDTLRELYMLSGNKCAMPSCKRVLIDGNGVVVGRICHIRAAMSDGPRFDDAMTNEARRHVSNLVMMCGDHHTQVDSKRYEDKYTLPVVTKIKNDHEAKFRTIGDALEKAFDHEYTDSTDALAPTEPATFERFDQLLKDDVDADQAIERRTEIAAYLKRIRLVPDAQRSFILAVINRALKLGQDRMVVPTDDLKSAVTGVTHSKLQKMRTALNRYEVGDLDLYGVGGEDQYCVKIREPSDYVSWASISRFCDLSGARLEDFVIDLKFGLLEG